MKPTLSICVPARPPLMDGESVRVEIVTDEGGTRLTHVRRVGLKPRHDLRQLRGELLVRCRLALPPLPVLVPDRTSTAALGPRRVHRDPASSLITSPPRVAARPGATREDGRATSRLRPYDRPRGTLAERLWGFCGDLGRTDADRVIVIISLPAFMQVKEVIAANSGSR